MNLQRTLLTLLVTLAAMALHAQELEYKYELGGGIGASWYLGDAGGCILKNTQPMGGAILRFVLNPHMAVKTNLALARISGSTQGQQQFYPETVGGTTQVSPSSAATSFSRTLCDLGAQFEYNFWSYGTGKGYKGTHRLTPYIAGGLGFTVSPKKDAGVLTLHLPIGMGVKMKVRERVNIGAEMTLRYTLSDKLDTTGKEGLQLDDPYGIKSSTLKNNDGYAWLMFFATYDLSPKYRKCNN